MFAGPPRYLRWLFEAQFWKDVTTRAVAAGIVVFLGYLYGVGAGTIPEPTNKNFVVVVAVVLISLVVSLLVSVPLIAGSDLMSSGRHKPLIMPTGGDVFGAIAWEKKRWWAKAPYYAFRWFAISFPLLGTIGLSVLLLWWLSP